MVANLPTMDEAPGSVFLKKSNIGQVIYSVSRRAWMGGEAAIACRGTFLHKCKISIPDRERAVESYPCQRQTS